MPRQSEELNSNEDSVRVFRGGVYLTHNAHVQNGRRREAGCGFCNQGLDAVVAVDESQILKNPVDADSGGDEEGAAAPPSGDGGGGEKDYVHWQGYMGEA